MASKQPQDRLPKKTKKVDPHDPSEEYTYEAPFSGVSVTLPYAENLPAGMIRRATAAAGDSEMAFYFALMEEILGDEYEETIDVMLQREVAQMVKRWESESATELGE